MKWDGGWQGAGEAGRTLRPSTSLSEALTASVGARGISVLSLYNHIIPQNIKRIDSTQSERWGARSMNISRTGPLIGCMRHVSCKLHGRFHGPWGMGGLC